MRKQNVSIDIIIQTTGLSREQIEKLSFIWTFSHPVMSILVVEILKKYFNRDLLSVYIFGSSITERGARASDIDIAIHDY